MNDWHALQLVVVDVDVDVGIDDDDEVTSERFREEGNEVGSCQAGSLQQGTMCRWL